MSSATTSVLLVENNRDDAKQILDAFAASGNGDFRIELVADTATANWLRGKAAEVVLIGADTTNAEALPAILDQVVAALPQAIVLVLGHESNHGARRAAVQRG